MIKYFRFNHFFNFCKSQLFLISYKNVQHFLQFAVDQSQSNKLIACCCYGHFLNTDMGDVLYLFQKYDKNFLFIQFQVKI